MSLGTLNSDPIESATIAYQIKEEFPNYEQTPIWDDMTNSASSVAAVDWQAQHYDPSPLDQRTEEEIHETFTFDLPDELTSDPA